MLVGPVKEQLVLLEGATGVHGIGIQQQIGFRLAGLQQNRASARRHRPANPLKHSMNVVCSRAGNHVVYNSRRASELRCIAVADGLNLSYVGIGNREQANSVAIALRIRHAIHLVVDAIAETIGIDRSRDAQLRVGMAAHARLKEDEVVRIARGQREVFHFHLADGSPDVDSRRVNHRDAATHFDGGADISNLERAIDDRLTARVEYDSAEPQKGETILLHRDRIRAQRERCHHIITFVARGRFARVPGRNICGLHGRAHHRLAAGIRNAAPNRAIDRFRLCPRCR